MEKEKLKIVAEFIKEMKSKHPVDDKSEIVIGLSLDESNIMVYDATDFGWEGFAIDEVEKITIE